MYSIIVKVAKYAHLKLTDLFAAHTMHTPSAPVCMSNVQLEARKDMMQQDDTGSYCTYQALVWAEKCETV